MGYQKIRLMNEAVRLSFEGMRAKKGGPFGAVIVKDGKVVGAGYNQVTSTNDPTAHAEVVAIRNACKHLKTFDLSGCAIYTSCEPCPMCLGAIYWARLEKIYYCNTRQDADRIGFSDNFVYEEFARVRSKRKLPIERLIVPDAIRAFKEWETKTNKIRY